MQQLQRPEYPAELYDALSQKADRDVEVTLRFLTWLGQKRQGEAFDVLAIDFPNGFLFELSAALQLLAWEQRGIFVHREAGLPSADDAIRRIIDLFDTYGNRPSGSRFQNEVLRLVVERFAWNGRSELNADIVLDDLSEDTALEALADFLWSNRGAGIGRDKPYDGASTYK